MDDTETIKYLQAQQHRCGVIHQGQSCTQPATMKIPYENGSWAYVCDLHTGLIIGMAIEDRTEGDK